jgi:type VI secretion system lysozyme-like protein
MKQRLLKRISHWEQAGDLGAEEADVDLLLDSITDDLEKLYNTRRGTVLIDEAFGMPDFSHLMNGYSAPDLGGILQQIYLQAKQYEPRLSALQVKPVDPSRYPGRLQFVINARVRTREQDLPYSVNALLADDGSVELVMA